MNDVNTDDAATIEELRHSFFYGRRSNLNIKFAKDLSDEQFGDLIEELFAAAVHAKDYGEVDRVADVLFRWQVEAYQGHLGDPADFPHRYDDVPFTLLDTPLGDARVALVTSSGHFVEGDDPNPFGIDGMTQDQAEARIGEFLREAPSLSEIPLDTPADRLRVRHGGYPIAAAAVDHQINLPLGHLRDLDEAGVIGTAVSPAYSFVGAASQVRLRKEVAPAWAEQLRDAGVDAVLLVPV